LPCLSEELSQLDIVVSPFEALQQADPEFARSLSQQLAQAIERDPQIRVTADGPPRYRLEGQVFAEGQRQFVALRLIETKTDQIAWFENYDYRGITAEMMAADLIAALSVAARPGAPE
jgi:TolB-like protein